MAIADHLKELGITLPEVPPPAGTYAHAVRSGNMLYLSGKGPSRPEGGQYTGLVGRDHTAEEAYQHARSVGLILLTVMEQHLGSLDKVKQVVKVLGMVNAVPEFGQQPKVINGCSDLFKEVFGERGVHARSAVGVGSLPNNITVEIEAIVEVSD